MKRRASKHRDVGIRQTASRGDGMLESTKRQAGAIEC